MNPSYISVKSLPFSVITFTAHARRLLNCMAVRARAKYKEAKAFAPHVSGLAELIFYQAGGLQVVNWSDACAADYCIGSRPVSAVHRWARARHGQSQGLYSCGGSKGHFEDEENGRCHSFPLLLKR